MINKSKKSETFRVQKIAIYKARWSVNRLEALRNQILNDENLSDAQKQRLIGYIDMLIDRHVSAALDSEG